MENKACGHGFCVHLICVKEISPGFSLEGMMIKLKLQYFGHLMQRVDSMDFSLSELRELVMDREA